MRALTFLAALLFCASLPAQVSVVNGASFRGDQPVAAGSWAAAFGAFSGVTTTTAPSLPYPTTLGGVTVTVDGTAAPVYFVSAGQINFLVPYSVQLGLRAVQIQSGGTTVTGNVRVIGAAPGLFVKDTTNQLPPKGAILNQDGSENTSSNQARRGQVISIYGTGPGSLSATVDAGAAAPSSPLANTQATPQVFIGGVAATVQFSGLAPNFAGLWQVNAFVPDRAFLTGRVPVQVYVNGVDSNEVTVFVAP